MTILTKKLSAKDVMIKYGVILGVLSIITNVIMYVTDSYLSPHWSFGVIAFLMTIAIIILAFKTFKESNGGFLKLGQALKIGLGVALISAVLSVMWTLVLTQVLEPNYTELALEAGRNAIIEGYPDMSDAQIDQALSFQEPFTKIGFMIPVAIMMSLFFGFIISLIGGLIMKNENPHADV